MYSLSIAHGNLIRLFVGVILVLGLTFVSGVFLGVGIGSRATEGPAGDVSRTTKDDHVESNVRSQFRKYDVMTKYQEMLLPKQFQSTSPLQVSSAEVSTTHPVEWPNEKVSND